MSEAGSGDPFRPFVVEGDDGTRLVLARGRSRSEWLVRIGLYLLVLLLVAMELLIVYLLYARIDRVGDVIYCVSSMFGLYLVLQLALVGFLVEGPRRIVAVRGELVMDCHGAVRRVRERVSAPVAIVARTTERITKHGDVRRLALEVRTFGRTVEIGSLHLDSRGEPTREAAAQAAAALLAARLGVPLELDAPARGASGG